MSAVKMIQVLGVALLLVGGISACSGLFWEITIPKELIEKQIAKRFPTVKSKGFMTVKLTDPHLVFLGKQDRIQVRATVEVRFLGIIPIPGTTVTNGALSYQPQTGAFLFTDIKVDSFTFEGLPKSKFDEVSGFVGTAIVSALGGIEVYKLNPKETTEAFAKLVLQKIRVTDSGVVVRVGVGK